MPGRSDKPARPNFSKRIDSLQQSESRKSTGPRFSQGEPRNFENRGQESRGFEPRKFEDRKVAPRSSEGQSYNRPLIAGDNDLRAPRDNRFSQDRNADRPQRFDRGNFQDRPRPSRDGAPRNFENRAPRTSFSGAPRAQVGDAEYNEPQRAVGGIREVETLLNDKPGLVHRVIFQKDSGDKRLYALQKKVKHLHIHHQQLEVALLDQQTQNHQGVVALCHEREVSLWEQVRSDLFAAKSQGKPMTVAVIVNIEDPRNMGACLRSCLALGVDVVLLASKGMCGLTPLAARASAGALEKLNLCRPDNLEAALGELVSAGYDLVGLDSDTPLSLHDTPFTAHSIIAVGGEDRELPPFIRKQCTKVLRIPMQESAHSYNASVALTLALYERARSLGFPGMIGK